MLTALSDILSLKDSPSFQARHRKDKPSNTIPTQPSYFSTILNKAFKKACDTTNTGISTLLPCCSPNNGTFSCNILARTSTAPLVAGHAIVNVGDSLRFLSENKFNSCLHRVVPVTSNEDRYSIAYFLRPENETRFKDMDGRKVKAVDWHDDKYVIFAEPHNRQERSSMLTGGMERNARIMVK